jgi:hypothetical protein
VMGSVPLDHLAPMGLSSAPLPVGGVFCGSYTGFAPVETIFGASRRSL